MGSTTLLKQIQIVLLSPSSVFLCIYSCTCLLFSCPCDVALYLQNPRIILLAWRRSTAFSRKKNASGSDPSLSHVCIDVRLHCCPDFALFCCMFAKDYCIESQTGRTLQAPCYAIGERKSL